MCFVHNPRVSLVFVELSNIIQCQWPWKLLCQKTYEILNCWRKSPTINLSFPCQFCNNLHETKPRFSDKDYKHLIFGSFIGQFIICVVNLSFEKEMNFEEFDITYIIYFLTLINCTSVSSDFQ